MGGPAGAEAGGGADGGAAGGTGWGPGPGAGFDGVNWTVCADAGCCAAGANGTTSCAAADFEGVTSRKLPNAIRF